jgi:hypothetical protein
MDNKHQSMSVTFQINFETPINDDEITDIMKEVDLTLDHPLVNNIILRKLSK